MKKTMPSDRILSVSMILRTVAEGKFLVADFFRGKKYFAEEKKLLKWKMICDYFAYFVMRLLGVLYFPENRAACHNSRDESRI